MSELLSDKMASRGSIAAYGVDSVESKLVQLEVFGRFLSGCIYNYSRIWLRAGIRFFPH